MSASGVFKRVRLGDEVQTHCGRCKEERTHQIVALNSGGGIERVTCLTCQSTHLYRDRQRETKKAGTKVSRQPAVKALSQAAARAYSPQATFAAGDVVSHPKFGLGEVVEARGGKIDVKFGGEKRTLLHAG
ncbi:MAG: hypothetical protein QOD00_3774 [Blastocatellia bacterium]|nr:hypothetical protein [Blastocatellia bacterium]